MKTYTLRFFGPGPNRLPPGVALFLPAVPSIFVAPFAPFCDGVSGFVLSAFEFDGDEADIWTSGAEGVGAGEPTEGSLVLGAGELTVSVDAGEYFFRASVGILNCTTSDGFLPFAPFLEWGGEAAAGESALEELDDIALGSMVVLVVMVL